jgi:hypothetical protein
MPTLSAGVVTAEMPDGEKITGLFYYLGRLIIGTTKGVRIASVSETTGDLSYGPLIFKISTTQAGIRQFVARDRFVWCSSGMSTLESDDQPTNSEVGLVRLDLSESIDQGGLFEEGLRFPYANDLQTENLSGITYGVSHLGSTDRLVYITASNVYMQRETILRESGFVTTGAIRYGTLEPKNYKRIRARGLFTSGSMDINTLDSEGNEYAVFTYNEDLGSPEVSTPNPTGAQELLSYKFILNRDTINTKSGPTFKGYQAKALPATPRQRLVVLPLFCYDVENDRFNNQVGYEGRAIDRIAELETLEAAGDEVFFQDFTTEQSGTCVIQRITFERTTSPDRRFSGFGGTMVVIIRLL